jgi:drug/metabolite transporter (DMT)-like permease
MNPSNRSRILPILQAVLAALLFGASAPFAKILLGDVEPVTLAGLLYLGSGLALLLLYVGRRAMRRAARAEARLQQPDIKWLAGAVLAGGVAAPILQMFGLRGTPGSTTSLLLNFESVATTLIAALVFKEQVGKRAWRAILLITLASILLSLDLKSGWGISLGALGVLGACVLWGVDNNFTRNISGKDPQIIVMVKGLAAGVFSLTLALLLGNSLPGAVTTLKALLLGSLSYGLSIILFIRAMRGLGAARTSALFATSPLAGILLSFIFLRETPSLMLLAALPLMALGTVALLTEEHRHAHLHPALIHEHAHRHDDGHHDHEHEGWVDPSKRHSHVHEHAEMTHDHEHMPDIDHRHEHAK